MPCPALLDALLLTLACWFAGRGLLPAIYAPSHATGEQWVFAAAGVALMLSLGLRGIAIGRADAVKAMVPGARHARVMAYLDVYGRRAVVVAAVVAYRAYRTGRAF